MAKKPSRRCYVHQRRDHLPLAVHNSDVGALSAVLRGAEAACSVGAACVLPMVSARGVTVSALALTPLAGGSSASSVATTSRASSSASCAAVGATIPAAASARAASPTRAPGGASASIATTASATVAAGPPAVAVPVGGERVALLTKIVLMRGGSERLRCAVVVGDPQARHHPHNGLRPPLRLPTVLLHEPSRSVDGQEALLRQLHQ